MVIRVFFVKTYEVADVEREDHPAAGAGPEKLRGIVCVECHPFAWRPGHVVASVDQGPVKRFPRCVRVQVEADRIRQLPAPP